jgi:glycosyltransferase involved in cell wall biosynthesis
MKTPMISVVMPTYNSEKYVAEAVQSILTQTFRDFEFLVVNECGSDDRTVAIVESFRDPRIRVIQNSRRLGIAESLNAGMRQSRGKYIARMDADDISMPVRFERQIAFMEANPDIAISGTWVELFGDASGVLRHCTDPEYVKTCMLLTSEARHPTVIMRSSEIRSHALRYDSAHTVEDFELFSRAVHVVKIANIPEVLLKYRIYAESNSVAKGEAFFESAGNIVSENLKRLGVEVSPAQRRLLAGFKSFLETKEDLMQVADLFQAIMRANQDKKTYVPEILEYVLKRQYVFLFTPMLKPDFSDEIADVITQNAFVAGKGGKVVLFGAGKAFHDLAPCFLRRLGAGILCVSDNNPDKWGRRFFGLECLPPERLPRDVGVIVLAGYDNMTDIIRQLRDTGFSNVHPFVNHSPFGRQCHERI